MAAGRATTSVEAIMMSAPTRGTSDADSSVSFFLAALMITTEIALGTKMMIVSTAASAAHSSAA
jgi:hypothetical protein